MQRLPDLREIREHVKESLRTIRPDIKRNLNPTPYKVKNILNVLLYFECILFIFIKLGIRDG